MCFNIGLVVMTKMKKNCSGPMCLITAIVLGYTVTSYYYFAIGMFQLYREPFISFIPMSVSAILVGLSVSELLVLYRKFLKHSRQFVLAGLIFFGIVLLKVFPDIGFDSNWYHLSQPLFYLKNGGIYHVGGYIFPSGYPQFTEMLFVPLLKWGDSTTTSLFATFNYLLLVLATYYFIKNLNGGRNYAILGALLALTTPVIFTYAGFSYVDILQGLCLLVAFYWIKVFERTLGTKDLIIAGVLLAPVCSIKYSGALLCVALAGYVVFSELNIPTKFRALLVLSIIPIIGLTPWLVRNKIEVNNFLDPMGTIQMFHYGSNAANYLEYLGSLDWLDTLSVLKTDKPLDFLVPAMVVTISIYTLLGKKWSTFVLVILTLIIYRSMPPGNHFRFFIPFIPLIIVLYFQTLFELRQKHMRTFLTFTAVFFVAAQFYSVSQTMFPISYALGIKNTKEFKNYYFVKEPYIFYDPLGRVKSEVGSDKLIVKGVDLIYPTLTEFNVKDYSFADLDRRKIYSFRTLRDEMLANGYEYILVNRADLQDHFSIWFKESENDIASQYFNLIIHEKTKFGKRWYLYKVREN
jgi:hypothetical protein